MFNFSVPLIFLSDFCEARQEEYLSPMHGETCHPHGERLELGFKPRTNSLLGSSANICASMQPIETHY